MTRQAVRLFAEIASRLRNRGFAGARVALFLNRIVCCLFMEALQGFPGRGVQAVLEDAIRESERFPPGLRTLFQVMEERFAGGLFHDGYDVDILPLSASEIADLDQAARLNWLDIDPLIFGSLFEAGLDSGQRKGAALNHQAVGVHYTDPATIMKLIEPVVLAPLRREWQAVKAGITHHRESGRRADADAAWRAFRERLGRFRVLDPACGCGAFLSVSLVHLKDFDREVLSEGYGLGLPADRPRVTSEAVKGLEIHVGAADLARIALWIGERQWQLRNGFGISRTPIPGQFDGIEGRDALLTPHGTEADWPAAEVVVGNPPFLGGKRLRAVLGDDYVNTLFAVYAGRVPAEADLVTYWFAKAWQRINAGTLRAAGLVTTNSIRGGANRRVLDPIARAGALFEAWDDEPWLVAGAAVRVSLIAFGSAAAPDAVTFDGKPVHRIHADLTASAINLTMAGRLTDNAGVAFMGDTKGGAFDIPGETARHWLLLPPNSPNRPNRDVLRPWVNGMDVTRRPADKWVIDFGWEMTEAEAALYEAPFAHVLRTVKPGRDHNRRNHYRHRWWRHAEARPGMWDALRNLDRYIATPTVAKYRLFVWLAKPICPDHQLIVIASSDDAIFGILHSRFHQAWALRTGTSLENRPRYTPSTTFETFPFPDGLAPRGPAAASAGTPPHAQAIAHAAQRLDRMRRHWLNPPDWVNTIPEIVPGYPNRTLPSGPEVEAELNKRTLTNLYNLRPSWLVNAHRALDDAVAAAYGWPTDIAGEEALSRLLALNLARQGRRG